MSVTGDTTEVGIVALHEGAVEYRAVGAPAGADAGPPLVLLHEGLGCVAGWGRFPEELARRTGREVLVSSRHGHGGSEDRPRPRGTRYLHEEAAGPLPELLAARGVRAPVLVGHSDGASIALLYAAASAPAEVSALVLIAPHVVVESRTRDGVAAAAAAFERGDLAAVLRRVHDDADTLFAQWSGQWSSDAFARDFDLTGILPGIDQPVLLVQGDRDAYGTSAQLDRIAAGVRGRVERDEPAGVGHHPHQEAPERLADRIAAFLRGTGDRR